MRVPEDVEADCVHAQCFAHFDALVPIGLGDAWIVQFCGFETNGLPFNRNCSFAGREVALSFPLGTRCPSCRAEGIVIVPSLPNSSGSQTVARVLKVFLFPAVEHGNVGISFSVYLLHVSALCIEGLVCIRTGTWIADGSPLPHDGVGDTASSATFGILSGTTGREI